MKQSSLRFLVIVASTALMVGAVLVYSNLVRPAYDEAKHTQGELVSKDKNFQEFQDIFNKLKDIFSAYKDYSDVQKNVSLALPLNAEVAQVLFQVTKLASLNDLTLQLVDVKELAITPSKSSLINPIGTVMFDLKMSGTYESLKNYLANLESNLRIMGINGLRIEKIPNVSTIFNYSVEVYAYYQAK